MTTSITGIASEKEYLLKRCKDFQGATKCDDEKCEIFGKISFKVNKQLNSVMATITINADNTIHPDIINNCKVFDDETFYCESTGDGAYDNKFGFSTGSDTTHILDHGKYRSSYHKYGWYIQNGKRVSNAHDSDTCATEIKSFFRWFQ
jgi:hypothetical protein